MSQTTMSSHLESSRRISTERLLLPVCPTSELPAYCHTILMGALSLTFVGLPCSSMGTLLARIPGAGFSHTPELKVSICSPWSMASSQENTGMILLDLVLVISVLKGKVNWKAWAPSRAPVPPPGMPMLPVTAASRKIARALFSPLA